MLAKAKIKFVSLNSGEKKETKEPYFYVRFLDEDAEQYVNIFTNEDVIRKIDELGLKNKQLVMVSLKVTIGHKRIYVDLVDIDIA